ncbi:MAG: hypothetical protein R2939_19205 [Kofleriaceae bacterium]
MSFRSAALVAGGGLVLASLIYLAVAVRGGPAAASIEAPSSPSSPSLPRATAPRAPAEVGAEHSPASEASGSGRGGRAGRGSMGGMGGRNRPGRAPTSDGTDEGPRTTGGDPTGELTAEASRRYDSQDYEGALQLSRELLETNPTSIRLLRIAVSSACVLGEPEQARAHAARLQGKDRADMEKRCERYGVSLRPGT